MDQQTKPIPNLENLSPQAQRLVKEGLNMLPYFQDFGKFCREALGYSDMIEEHEELCRFLVQKQRFKMILMPRYSFKSSISTVGRTLWELIRDPNARILIYSDASTKAEAFLTEIKNHVMGLKADSKFRRTFGNLSVDPKKGVWNQSQIVVKSRTQAHAEPSVDTGGIETSKVGFHYDIIIFDDIVSDKNITTKDQMDKVAECYRRSLSLLKPGGEVIIVGTRWHFGDLYGRLMVEHEKNPQFALHIRKAEVNGNYPFSKVGLTKEFLESQKASQGSSDYSCLYQNDPVDDETAMFKSTDFTFYEIGTEPRHLYITCTIDPAISQGRDSDLSAITVCGTDDRNTIYILDIVAGKLLPNEVVDAVFDLHERWHFQKLGIETTAFQKMLERDIMLRFEEERKRPGFRFFGIDNFKGISNRNKELRIKALQPYHERHALKFPGTRMELLNGHFMDLAYQMIQFPKAPHDDILDSLAYHVPLSRKGGEPHMPEVIPPMSPAWIEREAYRREVFQNRRQPRWRRRRIPALSLS